MAAAAETDLVRALKQIIELRNAKNSDSITLFGKKLSIASPDLAPGADYIRSSEKLPPAAIAHLKELYGQHLKRRAPGSTATVRPQNGRAETAAQVAAPVLENKRQRISLDRFRVAKPEETQAEQVLLEMDSSTEKASASEVAKRNPLTLFYNGKVHVYDEISEDMAKAIMVVAGNSGGQAEKNALNRTFTVADLPQARKASLKSFLEKRKHRLVIRSDNQVFIKSASPVSLRPSTPPPACGKVSGDQFVEQLLQIR